MSDEIDYAAEMRRSASVCREAGHCEIADGNIKIAEYIEKLRAELAERKLEIERLREELEEERRAGENLRNQLYED